jgi:hypothetical protein
MMKLILILILFNIFYFQKNECIEKCKRINGTIELEFCSNNFEKIIIKDEQKRCYFDCNVRKNILFLRLLYYMQIHVIARIIVFKN